MVQNIAINDVGMEYELVYSPHSLTSSLTFLSLLTLFLRYPPLPLSPADLFVECRFLWNHSPLFSFERSPINYPSDVNEGDMKG